ncbi:tetratricopeptide repeat protein [Pseudothauera rhizosphaerae]|uniref:Tetratricopeptide repeat protein n=1 Tax=Pseudothauera rhizosphaerae TaxID=2565932 RepID=A0A4S4AVZ3_9RHOO|nr:hypothetical protein [Pseudothauera rhizosphaerae]THF64192.1 hypothetical protein E6O51_02390 [Pseudothauera rhizosphaerae]
MTRPAPKENLINFGPLPTHINALLQEGVGCHRSDPARARALFRHAIEIAPGALPAYRCLLKLQNQQREFDDALSVATEGLAEAAHQARVGPDWHTWTAADAGDDKRRSVPQRFLLLFLKAMAFIELRRGNVAASRELVTKLQELDPEDGCGHSVIAAMLDGVDDDAETGSDY